MKRMLQFSFLAFLLFSGQANAARIFKWVDASGQTHYTHNKPPIGSLPARINWDGVSLLPQRWSNDMKRNAREFMNKARVKRIWVPELGEYVTVKLSTRALRTINKNGAYSTLVKAGLIKPVRPKAS